MLLFTTNAWATDTAQASTIILISIIIFLTFLFFVVILTVFSSVSLDVLHVAGPEAYFMTFILLFTTTASTRAAQQMANTNPKIIIVVSFLF